VKPSGLGALGVGGSSAEPGGKGRHAGQSLFGIGVRRLADEIAQVVGEGGPRVEGIDGELVSDDAGLQFGEEIEISTTQGEPTMLVVTAYTAPGGTRHILVSVTQNSDGKISATVASGAKALVEIATHAGLISIREAKLEVTVTPPSGLETSYYTEVTVTSGSATLTPTAYCRIDELPGGFKVSKDEDSAYRALQVGTGETAKMVKE
jgi:hypothetical protein